MNAPLPESVRKAIESASLDDKYRLERGRAFMSGVQALVRLPMLQRQRDAASGLNTAGFVSGYRGSPLGGYDQALWAAKKHLAEHQPRGRRGRGQIAPGPKDQTEAAAAVREELADRAHTPGGAERLHDEARR